MNLRLAQPDRLIDLSKVAGLDGIDAAGATLRIGARVTHARIEDGGVPGETGAYMKFVATGISYRSVRNRGTIGGSLAHADPAADWPSALLALGGEVVIAGQDGERKMPFDGFQIGPFATGLGYDEILVAVELPQLADGAKWGYYKVNRKPGEFADAIGAVVMGKIRRGLRRDGLGAVPRRRDRAEARRRLDGAFHRRGARHDFRARSGLRRLRTSDTRRGAQPGRREGLRMSEITVTINGETVTENVEPRLSLADFVRDHRRLTGTHLGCEHGVCGACTVLMNGEPVRSCITFAVVADGTEITTIEGFDEDEPMTQLRKAFHENHALQCGYCTPGMLVAARDIVTRLPDADEARVRLELAGNLCRCTGYVGIVNAILQVLEERRGNTGG